MALYLGIDCGGTTIKSGLYDEKYKEIAVARETLEIITKQEGYAERDMHVLKKQCFNTIKAVIAKSQIDPKEIKGIGISAQGKGLFAIDKDGNPCKCGILSADKRSLEIVRRWECEHKRDEIYDKTRQALWTGHPVSILRYLKENDRATYDSISDIFMSHDYLRYCLTKERAVEISNISESNMFNMKTNKIDLDLLKSLGIEECIDKIPKIVGSSEIAGYVTADVAQETGLCAGTPVVGGLFDVVSVLICANLQNENELNIAMGTWAVTSGYTNKITDEKEKFVYGRHANDGYYVVHEASPTSSGNLEWICKILGIDDFNIINDMVDKAKNSEVFFIPFLYGSNATLDNTAGFYGLQSMHTKANLFKAAFEGVVFSHLKHTYSIMRKFKHVDRLVVTGGPTHSPIWMQMLSDASAKELIIPKLKETGCLGAAMMAMVGTQLYKSISDAQNNLKVDILNIQPNLNMQDYYQRKYERYSLLVEQLSNYHKEINKRNLL